MGIEINKTSFKPEDYTAFKARLGDNLEALERLLEHPGFGVGDNSVGAELEVYIVDETGRPLYANQEIQAAAADPQLTVELNRYNLEYNLSPRVLNATPFVDMEREILDKLEQLAVVAGDFGGRVVPIGILPTLRQTDFGSHCVTDCRRYHALVAQLIKRRGSAFQIDISGEQPLQLAMSDITLEGANTSFQVHYRVEPEQFADVFNAVQLVTPLAVAVGANSPTLFGHRLWQETRVPLFKQSIDTRHLDRYGWNAPARVNFGHGWVRRGASELFDEAVRLYPPLLPLCAEQSAAEQETVGQVPSLAELRLHLSTVWLWNRPVYDPAGGGHLRIEMRALPAGPTAVDMVANAAFLVGLAEGMRGHVNELLPALPFHLADYNFYRAAQFGLEAKLIWPEPGNNGYREQSVATIIENLLPIAETGLWSLGVSARESSRYLDVVANRVRSGQTGAQWQLSTLDTLAQRMSEEEALGHLLSTFIEQSRSNQPVSEWSL